MKDVIFTEDDYRDALKRFLEICDAPEDSPEADDLEKLMYLLEIYEKENWSWKSVQCSVTVSRIKPETRIPKPETRIPKHETRNPKQLKNEILCFQIR